jgi:hypothetical protein
MSQIGNQSAFSLIKKNCDAKLWEKLSQQILNACNLNYNGSLQRQKASAYEWIELQVVLAKFQIKII